MAMGIRFELPDPSYASYTWALLDGAMPISQPPLLADFAMRAPLLPSDPLEPPQRLSINGFVYERGGATQAWNAALRAATPTPATVDDMTRWRREWLPQVEALVEQFESFDPSAVQPGTWAAVLDEQEREYRRVFLGVHDGVRTGNLAAERFTEAFVARFGEHRRHDALALLLGFPNTSLDRSIALWALSRLVRADPRLASALDSGAEPPNNASGRQFKKQFATLLKEFGHTNAKEMQDAPTWGEDPQLPLAFVRAYATQEDHRSPAEAARQQEERRTQLERELLARAQDDASAASLIPLVEMAQNLGPNLEDHNLLGDQRIAAASRHRWLAVGRFLQQRGAASLPDDVFYHHQTELIRALEGGDALSQGEIAQRRAFQDECRVTSPPPVLGKPLDEELAESLPVEGTGSFVLHGSPASRGSYRGRARVIELLADAASLVDGDVLVRRSTTPPWTPYFAVIGALVTNSGGLLSHAAIVAREFGVPAVIGTRNGTALIPDGATLTVDGTAGLVIVEVT